MAHSTQLQIRAGDLVSLRARLAFRYVGEIKMMGRPKYLAIETPKQPQIAAYLLAS